MNIQADLYGMIALFAIGHSIAIGIFLLIQKRKSSPSSCYLGLAQISGAFVLVSSLLTTSNVYRIFPGLIGISYPFIFLTGFFFMLYFRSLMEKDFHWDRGVWILTTGPLAGIFLSLKHLMKTPAERLAFLDFIAVHQTYPAYDWLVWTLGLLFNWGILITGFHRISRYRKALQREYADTEGVELRTLSHQLVLFLICWAGITLLSIFSFNRVIVDFSLRMSALFPAVYLLITSWTFLLNLVQSRPMPKEENPLKGTIPKKQFDEDFRIIQEEMEKNRHYLNPELTLPMLADKTSFFRNELSEIINVNSGSSFYHFVNGYRVEHVKQLLAEKRNVNILELAFASGFNSKGAFYNAFKRITGITPRQYQQEIWGNRHASA